MRGDLQMAVDRSALLSEPGHVEPAEAETLLTEREIGPLDGFRSKAGWPFSAELVLKYSEDDKNWKLEFDFGNDAEETGELIDFGGQEELGLIDRRGV